MHNITKSLESGKFEVILSSKIIGEYFLTIGTTKVTFSSGSRVDLLKSFSKAEILASKNLIEAIRKREIELI